ncbi:GNAT family N-acetyltransferase [Streptomyces sp. NPDC102462]|uniref:GNAT family N-acetyltransferase n=1 Tax=Streptomyces sp. NPDC102462 TaxID=3366178 RepID=UPI00382B9A99
MDTVALRPALPADDEFCFHLHKAAMGSVVTAIWGWNEQDQRAHHARVFDPSRWQIVTVDGADAGILVVEHRDVEVYLGRIELHPRYQGLGIGARLVRTVIETAARLEQDLVLDVLAANVRAHAFYLREGFQDVTRHGDENHKIRMRYALQSAHRAGTDG